MAMEFKKAKRSQARIKIAIGGPSGSGKTMSSLLLAYGLIRAEHPELSDADCWDRVCIIDTENGSGQLYVGNTVGACRIGDYNTIDLDPPFEPGKFVDAIKMAEDHNMEVIIIDSLSHAWVGEGGALDKQGAIAARSGNSYTAWRTVTPEHNKLVDAMLQSKCHVIADIRAKMDYQQTVNDKGKKEVKAMGMGLQMRDGIEYEFTVAFMLDYEHVASATKDRTGLFDGRYFVITPDVGKAIYGWLSNGAPASSAPAPVKKTQAAQVPAPAAPQDPQAPEIPDVPAAPADIPPEPDPFAVPDIPEMAAPEPAITMEQLDAAIKAYCADKTTVQRKAIGAKVAEITGVQNYRTITDPAMIERLYKMFTK